MPAEPLIDLLPELVLLVKRDGVLLGHVGGRGLAALPLSPESVGRRIDSLMPEPVAVSIRRLVKRVIAERGPAGGEIAHAGEVFTLHVTPQGADRALCSIRPGGSAAPQPAEAGRPEAAAVHHLVRRGFARRFRDSLSAAALRETPTAAAIILLEGVAEIGRIIDGRVAEQVARAALQRLKQARRDAASGEPAWYFGRLSDSAIALVLESDDRIAIEECVARACRGLRAPVAIGDASFHLTPYAGVAILGQDAASPGVLIDHARAAAAEARRAGAIDVRFFTDTIELRSLARLDIGHELPGAIADRVISLRYVGRHELASGRRVAQVGYLHWPHPLRGEVRPADFVAVAEATGLALSLSRAALASLRDAPEAKAEDRGPVCLSFGPLRHHVLHQDFVDDVERFLADTALPPERLEVRISERTFVAIDAATPRALARLGVRLVIDEVGRSLISLDRLARAPLSGLQLDRSWATGLCHDPVAQRACRAGIAVATALGLTPIATGVDDSERHQALVALGCLQGMGDYYAEPRAPRSAGLAAPNRA